MHSESLLPEKISSRIMKVEDGCWLWTGVIDFAGYGRVGVAGHGR